LIWIEAAVVDRLTAMRSPNRARKPSVLHQLVSKTETLLGLNGLPRSLR